MRVTKIFRKRWRSGTSPHAITATEMPHAVNFLYLVSWLKKLIQVSAWWVDDVEKTQVIYFYAMTSIAV